MPGTEGYVTHRNITTFLGTVRVGHKQKQTCCNFSGFSCERTSREIRERRGSGVVVMVVVVVVSGDVVLDGTTGLSYHAVTKVNTRSTPFVLSLSLRESRRTKCCFHSHSRTAEDYSTHAQTTSSHYSYGWPPKIFTSSTGSLG